MVRRSIERLWESTSVRRKLVGLLMMVSIFTGCKGSFPGIGTTNLQNPTRVPAPATGSFPVPGSYSNGSGTSTSSGSIGTGAIGTGVTPLNSQSSIVSGTSSTLVSSGLRSFAPAGTAVSEGWHASDLNAVAPAGGAGLATDSSDQGVATASFQRMTSRLSSDPSVVPASVGVGESADQEGVAGDDQSLDPVPVEDTAATWRKSIR